MTKTSEHPEWKALLKQAPDTRYLELLVADMNGILKGKRAPLQDVAKILKNGMNFCGSAVALDTQGNTFDHIPLGTRDGDPDVKARLVPGSLAPVPWASIPSAQAMLELSELDGTPCWLDPRNALKRALQPLLSLGLRPIMATELEFYLVEHDGQTFRPLHPRIPGSKLPQPGLQYGMIEDLVDIDPFLSDVDSWCRAQNIPAGAVLSEFAPGQFEINLDHVDDPLRACEHALLLKRVIKAAAHKHGLAATFMAKPFGGIPGSGLHIHVSLLDAEGNNVFAGKCSDGPFSDMLRHAIGGLRELMPESMAIFAPNANSFRRHVRGAYVPGSPNWGHNHRGVALRIPLSTPPNTRVEHRVAGADANPYLVVAAVMAGLHYGIANRCDPGRMVRLREEIDSRPSLPIRWPLALNAFDSGTVLRQYLGEEYCGLFAACRREEAERFQGQVSNRDYEWYLRSV